MTSVTGSAHIGIAGAGVLGRLLAWQLSHAGHRVEVFDPAFTVQVETCFIDDFSHSEEVDLWRWHATPWPQRLQQRLWGLLDRLLVNLLDRRR